MLPIYVCYDTGLNRFEIEAINEALEEVKALFPQRKIYSFGSAPWRTGSYSSADWYVQEAKRCDKVYSPGKQLSASWLLHLLSSEPFQQSTPHIDVMFTSEDLVAPGLNFCFGMTSGRYTVQSVYRYRSLSAEDRKLAIKAVLHHELGHVLGCAGSLKRPNTEDKLGHHCTRYGCVMRQGLTLGAWLQNAKSAKAMGRIYCPQCLEDAKRSRV